MSEKQKPLTDEEFRYAAMCADVPNKAVNLLSIYEGNNYEQAYEGLKLGIHWERMNTAQLRQELEQVKAQRDESVNRTAMAEKKHSEFKELIRLLQIEQGKQLGKAVEWAKYFKSGIRGNKTFTTTAQENFKKFLSSLEK